MKLIRLVGAASAAGMLSLVLVGSAAADSGSFTVTGPSSLQTLNDNNATYVTNTNSNTAVVVGGNAQGASTGNVQANDNTSVGGGSGSGLAENGSSSQTVIANSGPGIVSPLVSVSPASTWPGKGAATGAKTSVSKPAVGTGSGMVLGASTSAASPAILPVTGPEVPVNVSALLNAWHPQSTANVNSLAKRTSFFTGGMIVAATLLSLLSAAGSAMYIRRQERRV